MRFAISQNNVDVILRWNYVVIYQILFAIKKFPIFYFQYSRLFLATCYRRIQKI